MHMADALVSPAVGGAMWAGAGAMTIYCARQVRLSLEERKVPLMGALGAFVFCAQMVNFSIPLTGSSGHLGGGMLLAILLGPHAAFLTIVSVLAIQALFFADGGLLALGCNIFNLGFFPCFIAYPLLYRTIAGTRLNTKRIWTASMIACIAGLQMGAMGVVCETLFSGVSALPFGKFALLMFPIHLAIGAVEGAVTASMMIFVLKARPGLLLAPSSGSSVPSSELRVTSSGGFGVLRNPVLIGFLAVAMLTGGVLALFASKNPDGLEWAAARTTGQEELTAPAKGVYAWLAKVQERTAMLPDYQFRGQGSGVGGQRTAGRKLEAGEARQELLWADWGTSVSGFVGGLITLAVAGLIGFGLRKKTHEQSIRSIG
ncbi:MAG: energy-coupling factor ABC transporter permease [Candidatus Sumerlaeota bacterium]|nr:energy-coupling factor ABC transporter permease [Candidatus Sumerlaeota bacterium]